LGCHDFGVLTGLQCFRWLDVFVVS